MEILDKSSSIRSFRGVPEHHVGGGGAVDLFHFTEQVWRKSSSQGLFYGKVINSLTE